MELFPAYIIHSVPGRARFKIPAKRGDGSFFSRLEAILKACAGVNNVQSNSRSATILITYGMDLSLQSIVSYARRHRLFNLSGEQLPPAKTFGEIIADQFGRADRLITSGSRGYLDSQTIFFLLFLGLGLLQMWRGQIMQPAIPLLWRAMEILKDVRG